MMFRSSLLFLPLGTILVALQLNACANAFPVQPCTTKPRSTILASSTDDELDKLEAARANFEFLMHTQGLIRDDVDLPLPRDKDEYTPRPLTESSRHRRQLEMELLASLADSNDSIEELMGLWMLERGPEAADALCHMEAKCSPGLLEEEALLRDLMDEYGIHWAEPVSRLASLKFFQGQSTESEKWCDICLAVKPWHFEALHTHVLNALREQDLARALRWKRKSLPKLNPGTNNRARKAWVKRALQDAQESMDKAQAVAAEKKKSKTTFLRENEFWQ